MTAVHRMRFEYYVDGTIWKSRHSAVQYASRLAKDLTGKVVHVFRRHRGSNEAAERFCCCFPNGGSFLYDQKVIDAVETCCRIVGRLGQEQSLPSKGEVIKRIKEHFGLDE